jgi:hypothetical protein
VQRQHQTSKPAVVSSSINAERAASAPAASAKSANRLGPEPLIATAKAAGARRPSRQGSHQWPLAEGLAALLEVGLGFEIKIAAQIAAAAERPRSGHARFGVLDQQYTEPGHRRSRS